MDKILRDKSSKDHLIKEDTVFISIAVDDKLLTPEIQTKYDRMMSKGEIRKSPSPKRPQSTPVQMRRANTMDSQNLIGKTLKVQDWLNEKTVKGLQFAIPQAWVDKQKHNLLRTESACFSAQYDNRLCSQLSIFPAENDCNPHLLCLGVHYTCVVCVESFLIGFYLLIWLIMQEKCDVETKEARKLYTPLLETENTFVKPLD
ncbi:hypothetical protein KUTeg_007140 [Tegillarca granosa]|uniref:Uncharacterized protein n=1 Tax=Tegillarca granosa TaxID=220873 RepID=A0ABQ9FCD8_TEGGR|nr:hypothetical protein KUTeg_007140 [Tegillarca granosa]